MGFRNLGRTPGQLARCAIAPSLVLLSGSPAPADLRTEITSRLASTIYCRPNCALATRRPFWNVAFMFATKPPFHMYMTIST